MFCRYCGKEIEEEDRFCPQCGRKQIDIVAEAPDDVTSYMVQPMQAELEDVAIDLKYKRTFGIFAIILSLCWMADLLAYEFISDYSRILFDVCICHFIYFAFKRSGKGKGNWFGCNTNLTFIIVPCDFKHLQPYPN